MFVVICLIGIVSQGRAGNDASNANSKKGRKKSSEGKGNVDAIFWKRIRRLLKHVFTSWTCKEAQYVYLLTVLLVIRTFMSIWLADVNGRVVKAIVNKSFPEFLQRVSGT